MSYWSKGNRHLSGLQNITNISLVFTIFIIHDFFWKVTNQQTLLERVELKKYAGIILNSMKMSFANGKVMQILYSINNTIIKFDNWQCIISNIWKTEIVSDKSISINQIRFNKYLLILLIPLVLDMPHTKIDQFLKIFYSIIFAKTDWW